MFQIYTYLNNFYTKNKNLDEQLKSFNLNNNNITETDTVIFKIKKKIYIKTIYYFLTNEMKSKKDDINQ